MKTKIHIWTFGSIMLAFLSMTLMFISTGPLWLKLIVTAFNVGTVLLAGVAIGGTNGRKC